MTISDQTLRLSVADSPAYVDVDRVTGLPRNLGVDLGDRHLTAAIETTLEFAIGGWEAQNPVGGLEYHDTTAVSDLVLHSSEVRTVHNGDSVDLELDATVGGMSVVVIYRLYPASPYLELSIRPSAIDAAVIVRDVSVTVDVSVVDGGDLVLNAPGNHLRRNLPLAALERPLGVSPLGGLEGSSGLILLSANETTVSVWPTSTSEILEVSVEHIAADTARVRASRLFAGELTGDDASRIRILTLDIAAGGITEIRRRWHGWASRYGLTSPPGKPTWASAASIFEVQVGGALFRGGHVNEPYASVADITRDLDRIQELGFSVIQLMPRQPYPSYNVHDYWDVTTTYGDETELKALVEDCHGRGMTLILDVLLHGVLDKESIDQTIEGVKAGPYFDRLDEEIGDVFVQADRDPYLIAWSRHILDFGDAWRDGAPDRNRHEEENPDWFFRDSSGQVVGVYTKAFDARNPSMQRYFRAAMVYLMTELGIDGFRFDAPTYNEFSNWAPWARRRASASPLACVPLFEDMRDDIKAIHPEALMYTEPSGHLLRRSMDLNYNYDESWLVSSLGRSTEPGPHWVRTASEFMDWHDDRDAFLPVGSMTAHHVDSHDSFWWPDWGSKWRREQFAIERVQSLTASFLALDGPFMMFVGGEEGIQEVLAALNGVRREHPGFWAGPGQFQRADGQHPDLFWMTRRDGARRLDVIVNLAGTSPITVDSRSLPESSDVLFSVRASWADAGGTLDPDGILVVRSSE